MDATHVPSIIEGRRPIDADLKREIDSVFSQTLALRRKDFLVQLHVTPRGRRSPPPASDFVILAGIGSGSFGDVYLVRWHGAAVRRHVAMKVLSKEKIVGRKQVRHAIEEKRLTAAMSYPFVMTLHATFQDNANLFMVMPYMPCGDLFAYLCSRTDMEANTAVFLTAQVILGIEYLHNNDIVYRDLKPENIMMDTKGYLKIADFGFAKLVHLRAWTFCGTPEYIAPEIIKNVGYWKPIDWWAVGILIYELLVGRSPFHAKSDAEIFEKILECKPDYPENLSPASRDLMQNLIVLDPTRRYGSLFNGVMDIKCHPWFYPYDWIPLLNQNVEAPFTMPKKKLPRSDSETLKIPKSDTMLYADEFVDF
ncbi:unnamed protein product [Notodromas monacha]|uniref:Protein kinase domain-containing protein n=1 Tax=Notodromas monacha TaxID=399045 RepID=A0A7R9C1K0_9CRUS|nr:unnamed protein product [Notodromas monacha]CAG0924471.1 unnamed protein product [Notodromas monacha]